MFKLQFCLLTVSLLLALPMCHGRVWQFRRPSNFRQPSNSRGGSPPCSRDTVRLPSTPALIGLTPPVLVQRELIFSNSGDSALVLFEGSGLRAFHEFYAALSDPSQCQDVSRIRNLDFNFTKAMDWFHPGNWEMKSATNPAESAFNFDALPVDRIPGPCDSVHFDENSTYLVKVLDRGSQLSVGQLQIAGKIFDNQADNVLSQSADRLTEFWTKSDLPKRQFEHSDGGYADEMPFSIADTAASGLCDMPLSVRHPALMSRVCAVLSTSADRATLCSDPIPAAEVIGGCSALCGGIVISLRAMSVDFSLQQLRNDLQQQLRSSRMLIRMSVFRTSISEPLYQLVLMRNDSNAAASSDGAETSLFNLLQWLRNNVSQKKFHIVKTTISGDLSKSFAQFQNGSADQAASGSTIGLVIFFVLLIVVAAAGTLVFVGRKRGWIADLAVMHPGQLWQAWRQRRHTNLQEEEPPGQRRTGPAAAAATGVLFSISTGRVGFTSDTAEPPMDLAFSNPVFMSEEVTQPDSASQFGAAEPQVADREL